MEIQEGNNHIEKTAELRRVPTTPQSGIPNREKAWPSVNCSDDWLWGNEPEEQWEQCPMDIPERMGAEMLSNQGYIFANDSGFRNENETCLSPCISIISNPLRKRALSKDPGKCAATEAQITLRTSEELDHQDQLTQWSTPDLDHQQVAKDNMEKDTVRRPITPLLLCNSCWCHWSEHYGPFSCTSPYIWCLKIS